MPYSRRLLRLTGSDVHHFLQGLVTNDVDKLSKGLVYAAMLTPQGKYLADFFMLADDDGVLLDTDAAQTDALAKRLGVYKLRADVQITEDPRMVSTGTNAAPEGSFADPRAPDLGWRSYGTVDISDDTDWDALRVAHQVPQAGIELTPDSFILEMGFERLGGVDFKKGCYVGQEVTARMKHKTEFRKGLARVNVSGDAAPGAPITTDAGKAAGTLHTVAAASALAYLRFDRASGALNAGPAQITWDRS